MKSTTKTLTFIVLTLLLATNFTSAQKIEWGELQTAKSKNYYPSILSEDNDGIYTVAALKNDYIVEKYDKKKNKKVYATVVKTKGEKYKENKINFEGAGDTKDKFILFASYFKKNSKKDKTSTIYAFTVDKKTGKRGDKKVELFQIPVEKKWRKGAFAVYSSTDGKRMLIRHTAWYKKQKKFKIKYRLVDEDLNILVERNEQYGKEDQLSLSNFVIDDEGSLFFTKNEGSTWHIVSYDANQDYEKWEEKLDTRKLGMDAGAVITTLNFTLNAKNDLVLTGYYSTNKITKKGKKKKKVKVKAKDRNILAGCFFLKIDGKSKEIVVSNVNKFDKKFNDQFKTKRDEKKGKEAKIRNEFKYTNILAKDDGGVILIGEKYEHHYYYDKDGNVRGEMELFLDLVVINMGPDGELIWANRIPKLQKFTYFNDIYPILYGSFGISLFVLPRVTEYFSYMAGMDEKNVYVIFNDNPANALSSSDQDRTKPLKKLNKAAPILFTMNLETGKKEEELFTDGKDFQIHLKPIVNYQKDQKSPMVTFGKKGKKYKYGVLTF